MTVRLSYTYIYYYIQGLILYYFLSMEICQISLAPEVLLRPPAPNSDCARQSPNRFGFCARWHVVSSFAGAKVRQLYDMTKFSDNFFQNFFQKRQKAANIDLQHQENGRYLTEVWKGFAPPFSDGLGTNPLVLRSDAGSNAEAGTG